MHSWATHTCILSCTGGPDLGRAAPQRDVLEEDEDVLDEDEEEAARDELAHGSDDGSENGGKPPSSISEDEGLTDGEDVLKYTGKVAARSVYISERARHVDGCTYAEALKKKYRNKQGQLIPYRQVDLEYDVRNGFLMVQHS